MLILPAIDLIDGKCVRLKQGDPKNRTIYSEDPVTQAEIFKEAGAKIIHIVDLDGAFEGSIANFKVIEKIINRIGNCIEIGGGIRSAVIIENYLSIGVKRCIVGTFALKEEFADVARDYKDTLIVGIDAKNGFVATHGWKRVTDTKALDFAKKMETYGISEFIYTDIATDGMLQGPNLIEISTMVKELPNSRVIASGGVSSIEDIQKLSEIQNLKGCIVGKAIYDKKLSLDEAFKFQVV
jgi:phosphoribosylformimino-5-aminoimidazole carboxamide ribotide isomerase